MSADLSLYNGDYNVLRFAYCGGGTVSAVAFRISSCISGLFCPDLLLICVRETEIRICHPGRACLWNLYCNYVQGPGSCFCTIARFVVL